VPAAGSARVERRHGERHAGDAAVIEARAGQREDDRVGGRGEVGAGRDRRVEVRRVAAGRVRLEQKYEHAGDAAVQVERAIVRRVRGLPDQRRRPEDTDAVGRRLRDADNPVGGEERRAAVGALGAVGGRCGGESSARTVEVGEPRLIASWQRMICWLWRSAGREGYGQRDEQKRADAHAGETV
jgi:hypothetical protein